MCAWRNTVAFERRATHEAEPASVTGRGRGRFGPRADGSRPPAVPRSNREGARPSGEGRGRDGGGGVTDVQGGYDAEPATRIPAAIVPRDPIVRQIDLHSKIDLHGKPAEIVADRTADGDLPLGAIGRKPRRQIRGGEGDRSQFPLAERLRRRAA